MIFVYENLNNRFRVETRDYFIGYLINTSEGVWKFETFECCFLGMLLNAKDLQEIVDKLIELNGDTQEDNPWRENTGKQPVDDDVRVDVKFFGEDKVYHDMSAKSWGWVILGKDRYEIQYWRYAK
jgi:hypothetical protein